MSLRCRHKRSIDNAKVFIQARWIGACACGERVVIGDELWALEYDSSFVHEKTVGEEL